MTDIPQTTQSEVDVVKQLKNQALDELMTKILSTESDYKKILGYTVVDLKTKKIAVTEDNIGKIISSRRNTGMKNLNTHVLEKYEHYKSTIAGLNDVTKEDISAYCRERFKYTPVWSTSSLFNFGQQQVVQQSEAEAKDIENSKKLIKERATELNEARAHLQSILQGISSYLLDLEIDDSEKITKSQIVNTLTDVSYKIRQLKEIYINV